MGKKFGNRESDKTIYTLVETHESNAEPYEIIRASSHKSVQFARTELVNRIVSLAQKDGSFSYALWYDVNNGEELREYLIGSSGIEDVRGYFDRDEDEKVFPSELSDRIIVFIMGHIAHEDDGTEIYHIYEYKWTGHAYHFDIVPNELES